MHDAKNEEGWLVQYIKIKEAILEQIDSGVLKPRQKLPAERAFAELFETTRVTLREALALLEAEGKIYREDRRGWFISPMPLRYDPNCSLNFQLVATLQSRQPSTTIISVKKSLATKQASRLLELPPFSNVFCLDRLRCLEERPVAFVKKQINPLLFPTLLECDLSGSITDTYRNKYDVILKKSRYRICSTSLTGDIASTLRATAGTPAMLIERTNYDQHGEIIDCDIEYWRHDSICIESEMDLK